MPRLLPLILSERCQWTGGGQLHAAVSSRAVVSDWMMTVRGIGMKMICHETSIHDDSSQCGLGTALHP